MLNIVLIPSFHLERDLYLNLLYIAHFLEKYGHHVTIFDVNKYYDEDKDEIKVDDLVRDLADTIRSADLVGLSSYKMYIDNDREIYSLIKEIRHDIPIVIGGWGPTLFPVEYLKIFKGENTIITYGVHGQGLKAFLEIVNIVDRYSELRKEDLTLIKSIGFIDSNDNIILNELGEVISSDELPVINWRIERFGLDPRDYTSLDNSILVPTVCALASCPKYYRDPCIYCSIGKVITMYKKVYGPSKFFREIAPRLTKVTLERVVEDIKNAYEYFVLEHSVSRFSVTLVDDCVLPHVIIKLIEKLRDLNLLKEVFSIKFQTRPEYIPKIIKLIRSKVPEAEQKLVIDVGIEFFNNNDLYFTHRGYDFETVERCLSELSRSSVKWTMYVILATPVSSPEDLARNIEYSIIWSEKTYLLRTNPFLFEEGSLLTDIMGESNIVYRTVDTVRLPVRPRFLQSRHTLREMIEIVEYYIQYVEYLSNKTLEELSTEIDPDLRYRKVLKYQSLMDLLESLRMLKKALEEDSVYLKLEQRNILRGH